MGNGKRGEGTRSGGVGKDRASATEALLNNRTDSSERCAHGAPCMVSKLLKIKN